MRQSAPVEKLLNRRPYNDNPALLPQQLNHLIRRRVGFFGKPVQNEFRMGVEQ